MLLPGSLVVSLLGVFAVNNSVQGLLLMIVFGIPQRPIILGMVLGRLMEQSLRQALIISNGSLSIFASSPLAIVFIGLAIVSVFLPTLLRRIGAKDAIGA